MTNVMLLTLNHRGNNMFGSLLNLAVNTVTAPVRMASNALDIVDGLTVGELRTKAIYALGEEAVYNMTQSELIEWYRGY